MRQSVRNCPSSNNRCEVVWKESPYAWPFKGQLSEVAGFWQDWLAKWRCGGVLPGSFTCSFAPPIVFRDSGPTIKSLEMGYAFSLYLLKNPAGGLKSKVVFWSVLDPNGVPITSARSSLHRVPDPLVGRQGLRDFVLPLL
jgi:hypothetical protein